MFKDFIRRCERDIQWNALNKLKLKAFCQIDDSPFGADLFRFFFRE